MTDLLLLLTWLVQLCLAPTGLCLVMSHKANVLRTYRDLLELVHCLPAEKRAAAAKEARSRVREGAAESNAVKQSDLLKQLVARVSFLRACTPRHAWRHRAIRHPTHYVFRGGELVEGQGHAESRYSVSKTLERAGCRLGLKNGASFALELGDFCLFEYSLPT